jgi:hypothetical protein
MTADDVSREALAALDRLADQAVHTAGRPAEPSRQPRDIRAALTEGGSE